MPSPFPGMDPYLEAPAIWEGFNQVFLVECMYFLSQRLTHPYVANLGERVELVSRDDEAAAPYLPDVTVSRERRGRMVTASDLPGTTEGGVALAVAPVTIASIDSLEVREGYVQILRMPDFKRVTSIELLSPWNKYGEGVGEYRHKRRAVVSQGVHVVEIDLLASRPTD